MRSSRFRCSNTACSSARAISRTSLAIRLAARTTARARSRRGRILTATATGFFGADGQRYRDIMAYPPGIELGYFSNPNVVAPAPVSAPMGIRAGRAGKSDTARTIEQAAFEVAGYRLQTQAPPAAGTLVNVATRASATEARVVIAGFTVTGTQPKAMLLRAAGPALTAFGVNDALAAPVLELYAGATRIAENARWSAQANADAITGGVVGGGRVCVCAGRRGCGALGHARARGPTRRLCAGRRRWGRSVNEAYETTSGASRIVNLSTRAFCGTKRPPDRGGLCRAAVGRARRNVFRCACLGRRWRGRRLR